MNSDNHAIPRKTATVSYTAKALGISNSSVHRAIARGDFVAQRLGRLNLVVWDSVEKWLAGGRDR